MGLFGKKKVVFESMGMFTSIKCPCNLSKTGMDYMYPQRDEIVSGFTEDMLMKCGSCGIIFVGFSQKDQGRIVGKGRTFDEEKAQGLKMRTTLNN